MRNLSNWMSITLLLLFTFLSGIQAQKSNEELIEYYLTQLSTIDSTSKKLPIINEAIQVFEERNDKPTIAGFYRERGKAYSGLGKTKQAIKAYEFALNISRQLSDTSGITKSLLSLGGEKAEIDEYQEAIKYTTEAINLFSAQGDSISVASALNTLGVAYEYRGMLKKAEELFQQSLQIGIKKKSISNQMRALTNLGVNSKSMGRFAKAAQYFKRVEAIADSLFQGKPHKGYVMLYNGLSDTYRRLGVYDLAIKYAHKCKQMAEQVEYALGEVMFASMMGDIFLKQEQFDLAAPYYEKIKIAQTDVNRSSSELATSYNQLGIYYYAIEEYTKAEKNYLAADSLYQMLGKKTKVANNYQLLAELHGKRKQLENAKEYIKKSATLLKEVGDTRLPIVQYGILGEVLLESKKHQEAIPLLLKAEKVTDSLQLRDKRYMIQEYLFKAYSSIDDNGEAIKYGIKLLEYNKRNTNEQLAVALAEANADYGVDILSADLEKSTLSLVQEKIQRQEENARNKAYMLWLGAGLILATVLTFFFRYLSRLRRDQNMLLNNHNRVLSDANRQLELQTQVIEQQKYALQQNNIELGDKLSGTKKELEELNLIQNRYIQLPNKMSIRPLSIYYFQSDRNYLDIFMQEEAKPIIVRQTLKNLLSQLPSDYFVQINKSAVVNIRHIKEVKANTLKCSNGQWLKISPTFRPQFEEKYTEVLLD